MKIKVNKPLLNHRVGEIVDIEVNQHDVPTSIYWRRRLRDAQIDRCIEIVRDEPAAKESKSEKKRKKIQSGD
jgi:hypothetical protein